MATGPFGYKSEADFQKAIDRELREASVSGDDRGRQQAKPKRKALRGKPGSKERLAQAAKLAGVPLEEAVSFYARTDAEKQLRKAVKSLGTEFTEEAFDSAVAAIVSLDDPTVAEAFHGALGYEAQEAFESKLSNAIQTRDQGIAKQSAEAEQARLTRRQALLENEYTRAENLGPEILEVVDREMQEVGTERLYNPELSEEELLVASRVTQEATLASRDALDAFGFHVALDDEIRRGVGAPGSSWTDSEREKWEQELTDGSIEVYESGLPSPGETLDRAIDSLTPSGFTNELNAELDRFSGYPADKARD